MLAHEFGHFTQGAGMRLTYVIRSINFWFARVVYERDEWDARLDDWAERARHPHRRSSDLARLFVWLTRRILWVLMMVGHVVSGLLLRQMEFDADRYEARWPAATRSNRPRRQVIALAVATQGAYADLSDFYREGRLGDDLPRLMWPTSPNSRPRFGRRSMR